MGDQMMIDFHIEPEEARGESCAPTSPSGGTTNWTQARIPIAPAESCDWDGAYCILAISADPKYIAHKRRIFAGLVRETNPKTGAVRFIPAEHRLRSEERSCIIKPYEPKEGS